MIKARRPEREPTHPGKLLEEFWLKDCNRSQKELAEQLCAFSPGTKLSTMKTKLNELIKGKRSVSAHFAILLERTIGVDSKMLMNAQVSYDLWHARTDSFKKSA